MTVEGNTAANQVVLIGLFRHFSGFISGTDGPLDTLRYIPSTEKDVNQVRKKVFVFLFCFVF